MRTIYDIAAGEPWLITEDALRQVLSIAAREDLDMEAVLRAWEAREESAQALAMKSADRLPGTKRVSVRDGVAVMPVTGPIMRYADLFSSLSGATSTEGIAKDLQTALDSPDVHSILMNYDTPGGQAKGIAELAQAIQSASKVKPITAYVGDMAASAGYWLASSAPKIVMSPTGMVGSIGAAMAHTDTTQRDTREGVRNLRIVSSQSPKKQLDPASHEGEQQYRAILDAYAEQFISHVAQARGVTPDAVTSDFGQGGMIPRAADAVKLGMADSIGTFESTVADMAKNRPGRASPRSPAASMAAHLHQQEKTMAHDVATISAADFAAANPTAAEALRAEGRAAVVVNGAYARANSAVVLAALAEAGGAVLTADVVRANHPAIADTLRAEGAGSAVTAERERISKISARTLPGHSKLRDEAIAAGTPFADFLEAQTAAEQEKGPRKLEQLRANERDAPQVDAATTSVVPGAANLDGGGAEKPLDERIKADWDKSADTRAEFAGNFDAYAAYRKAEANGQVKRFAKA